MKVLVTRPAEQAEQWAASLRARGVDAVALPLLGIEPTDNTMQVVLAWVRAASLRLVIFVSPNAVEQFFRHKPPGLFWPAQAYAASTGPGTSYALVKLGVPRELVLEPASDSVQFDSEALWRRIETMDWQGAQVLIVRGQGGREWLADKLTQRGATVTKLVAYRSAPPKFSDEQRAILDAALADPAHHLWLFSSSESINNLAAAVTFGNWGKAWAVTTHPRIAARAQEMGFSNVIQTRPALDAVVACIQSIGP